MLFLGYLGCLVDPRLVGGFFFLAQPVLLRSTECTDFAPAMDKVFISVYEILADLILSHISVIQGLLSGSGVAAPVAPGRQSVNRINTFSSFRHFSFRQMYDSLLGKGVLSRFTM